MTSSLSTSVTTIFALGIVLAINPVASARASAFVAPARTAEIRNRRPFLLISGSGKANDLLVSIKRKRKRRRSRWQQHRANQPRSPSSLWAAATSSAADAASNNNKNSSNNNRRPTPPQPPFSLPTALFLAGLAFDAYVEPPPSSSRWERGSSGVNVAFLSAAYTRSLYKGIVEVTPLRASDLPDEDDAAEGLITGGGVDAALLVAVVEGAWKEDVEKLERETYHDGVRDLAGCAHVGRSSTAWSNVDAVKGRRKRAKGGSGAYHVPSSWGKGGQAVWEGDPPFYLYVQEPKSARLVFTLFDEDVVGGGQPIASAHRKLAELLPGVGADDAVAALKSQVIDQLRSSGRLGEAIAVRTDPVTGEEETIVDEDVVLQALTEAAGSATTSSIKMSSKPRKKDKGGQRALGIAAGAMVAGPVGAAAGGILASMYEGEVRGRVEVELKYTPIPQVDLKLKERMTYLVKGGLPGVEWGQLFEKHANKATIANSHSGEDATALPRNTAPLTGTDLEFCCFVSQADTGCSCAIYRSLERKLIAVSFRGTCTPVDLVTDASIAQLAWVDGEDVENIETAKVHSGFRKSLDSIARRLKELVLAAVAPGEDLAEYGLLVTGHSLGGALATCFTMDVAEYGMDAGRGLPQLAPSEAWWSSIVSTFGGNKVQSGGAPPPPRPRSLKMYNFGSPRVGNKAFCDKFDALVAEGRIDEAYRIVNGQDVVTRMPRTVNALVLGSIGYEHCGPTVLITELSAQIAKRQMEAKHDNTNLFRQKDMLWIEGESDDAACPVRDGTAFQDPMGTGSLLGDIRDSLTGDPESKGEVPSLSSSLNFAKLGNIAGRVTDRLQQISAEDLGSVVGIDQKFTQREMRFLQSIVSGEGLSHHMEDRYYQGMGLCCGFAAIPGQELTPLEEVEISDLEEALR